MIADRQADPLARFGGHDRATATVERIQGRRTPLYVLASHVLPWVDGRYRKRLADVDIGRAVDDLSPRRRRKLFRLLHEPLGDLLTRSWDDWVAAPYTTGWDRRAYRAPAHATLSTGARTQRVRDVLGVALAYPQDAAWFAHWTGHLQRSTNGLGELMARAIDAGDDQVFAILHQLALGRHETARFASHVPIGLLGSSREDGWDAVVSLLRAAQRQEGLRQSILEAVDLAHPGAFRLLLGIVVEDGLTRFAATVRAASVWLGEEFEVRDRRLLDDLLERARTYLEDDTARTAALADGGPDDVQLALFATSFHDAVAGGQAAFELLHDDSGDRRLAAVRHLADLRLPHLRPTLGGCVADRDLRVAAVAANALRSGLADAEPEAIASLVDRLDGDVELPLGIHRPHPTRLAVADVADLLARSTADDALLRSVLPRMSPGGREQVARRWADRPQRYRTDLLDLTADRASGVRQQAFAALATARIDPDEAPSVEDLLRRTSGDVRRGAIQLLLNQRDPDLVASAERLLAGTKPQLAAAVELVVTMREEGRATRAVDRLAAAALADDRVEGADRAALVADDGEVVTATGLVDHDARTVPVPPTGGTLPTAGDHDVLLLLRSLDAWLLEHRDVEVAITGYGGTGTRLVGDLQWLRRPEPGLTPAELRERMPLAELLGPWEDRVLSRLQDAAHTAVRATAAVDAGLVLEQMETNTHWTANRLPAWTVPMVRSWAPVEPIAGLATTRTIRALLPWLAARDATASTVAAAAADAVGTLAAIAATKAARQLPDVAALVEHRHTAMNRRRGDADWRTTPVLGWTSQLETLLQLRPDLDGDAITATRWQLARWLDEPRGQYDPVDGPRVPYPDVRRYGYATADPDDLPVRPARYRPGLPLLLAAHGSGAATDGDLDEAMLTERVMVDLGAHSRPGFGGSASVLGELTRRTPSPVTATATAARERAAALRDRIVDAEIGRGELPTPTSSVTRELRSVIGADRTLALLAGMGRAKMIRGYAWRGGDGRAEVFSRLLRVSFPAPDDDHSSFAAAAEAHRLKDRRLLELAMYAPQWAPDVELTLGWDGLTDAVRWVHAHTKDDNWSVDRDVRAEWDRTSHEQSPLAPTDLLAGAVDVAWFRRIRDDLGDERLDQVLAVGKYASSAGGHKRAQLYADALRGATSQDELVARIEEKRHKDAVRAIGLLPLPDDDHHRKEALLSRYEVLHAFDHGRRRFGQQRQASEAAAFRIGLDNLARTAGYRDAQRLTWRMESAAVADLAEGPVVVERDDVRLELAVDDDGAPTLSIHRGTRSLKNVPKTLRKDEGVVALRDRAKGLRQQASRIRIELEMSAIRGDLFAAGEFADMFTHPVLRPMLARLVVVDGDGALGLPTADGTALTDVEGARRPLGSRELRIAHPVDLLRDGLWTAWQHRLFADRLRQPFKQVFRELYVPTAEEADEQRHSTRFAGHQVQRSQAYALFGSRGWVVDREGGTAVRTFHDEGITAMVTTTFVAGTVAEVEDPTVEHVWFVPRERGGSDVEDRRPLELDVVPPRVFSEVMRDVDLVVSVAHAGGVDPEASASTIDVRNAVVRETAELLSLDNVEVTDAHALVTGQLNTYSIHLGSGQVHRRPGNAVCIIPVGAQHRGRVFLPFADDDPKTAEVVSKVVLLADDAGIKDPSILAQLG